MRYLGIYLRVTLPLIQGRPGGFIGCHLLPHYLGPVNRSYTPSTKKGRLSPPLIYPLTRALLIIPFIAGHCVHVVHVLMFVKSDQSAYKDKEYKKSVKQNKGHHHTRSPLSVPILFY
jgi:hypothetical protein